MRDSPVGGSTRGERAACACGQRVSARCARELRVGKRATILVVAARELCRGFAGKAEVLLEFSKVLVCVPHDTSVKLRLSVRVPPRTGFSGLSALKANLSTCTHVLGRIGREPHVPQVEFVRE